MTTFQRIDLGLSPDRRSYQTLLIIDGHEHLVEVDRAVVERHGEARRLAEEAFLGALRISAGDLQ